jgi:hypothetical protein
MPFETAAVGYTPMGFQTLTPVAATFLTVPVGARIALLSATTGAVSWRDDGGVPTAAVGIQIPAGTTMQYTGNLSALQVISATGTLNISYYR